MSRTFAELGVPPKIVASMRARSIAEPFAIQAVAIPDALAGRDLCGKAPTGSGKTIAFGIPLVVKVGKASARRPTGLVLVPTRELANQVDKELNLLARSTGIRVMSVYGGVSIEKQVNRLAKGVEIVVACPGRLLDLIERRALDLRDTRFVVIDEADRMADMGFMPDVRRILDTTNKSRQTLLFSATLDGDVDQLVRKYQRNPVTHDVTPSESSTGQVDHLFWSVPSSDRVRVAAEIIDRAGRTIVFCRTKHGADRVAKQLHQWGVTTAAIHGDRSQSQRQRALDQFHDGRVAALVATDVAARGIHVDDVAGVVHFDPPGDHKDYQHRSGRTGRAGRNGLVVSLVVGNVAGHVRNLQRSLGLPQGIQAAGSWPSTTPAVMPGVVGGVIAQPRVSLITAV